MEPRFNFRKAVDVYGGFSGLATAMDESLSTVHGWWRRKKVPKWRQKQIVAMAKADRKDVFGPMVAAKKKKRTKRTVQ